MSSAMPKTIRSTFSVTSGAAAASIVRPPAPVAVGREQVGMLGDAASPDQEDDRGDRERAHAADGRAAAAGRRRDRRQRARAAEHRRDRQRAGRRP